MAIRPVPPKDVRETTSQYFVPPASAIPDDDMNASAVETFASKAPVALNVPAGSTAPGSSLKPDASLDQIDAAAVWPAGTDNATRTPSSTNESDTVPGVANDCAR